MSTVAQLINRIQRDWLEPADDQPARFALSGNITDTATSLTYDDTLLSPEEEDLLGPGTLVEIDEEEILVGTTDATSNTASALQRGVNGTTKAAHSSGALIKIAPTFRRRAIFDAVCDELGILWPELFQVKTTTALTLGTGTPTEVPANVQRPMGFWGQPSSSSTRFDWLGVQLLDPYPPSSTGKAIVVNGLPFGGTGYLVYRDKFTVPTDETKDLEADCGLSVEWERVLMVGVVAYMIAGREVDQATQHRLAQQLERQGFPVMSATRIRQALLAYYDRLLDQAKQDLKNRYRTSVNINSVVS